MKTRRPDMIPSTKFNDFVLQSLGILRAAALRVRTELPADAARTKEAVCVYFLGSCLAELRKRLRYITRLYPFGDLQTSVPAQSEVEPTIWVAIKNYTYGSARTLSPSSMFRRTKRASNTTPKLQRPGGRL
jgi:hypothetical protein